MQHHKSQIEAYLKHNQYELTYERKILISILESMTDFNMSEFRALAGRHCIATQTIYAFKDLLIDAKIILPEVKTPARFNDNKQEIDKVLEAAPKKSIQNEYILSKVLKSYL